MIGRIAVGLLIFFVLTMLFGQIVSSGKHAIRIGVAAILVLIAYVAVTAVYFLSKFGYV